MEEKSRPGTEMITVSKWTLRFIRMLRDDVKNTFPKAEVNQFIPAHFGYQEIALPTMSRIIAIGTQIGRYTKALAVNNHLATNGKRTANLGMVSNELCGDEDLWYWGNYWGGYGLGFTGQMGIAAYGNGEDYGDFAIDWESGILYTSPTFRYLNIVVKGLTDCIGDSVETCIETDFITSCEYFLDWQYEKMLRSGSVAYAEKVFWGEYKEKTFRRNRMKQAKFVRTLERVYGYVGH